MKKRWKGPRCPWRGLAYQWCDAVPKGDRERHANARPKAIPDSTFPSVDRRASGLLCGRAFSGLICEVGSAKHPESMQSKASFFLLACTRLADRRERALLRRLCCWIGSFVGSSSGDCGLSLRPPSSAKCRYLYAKLVGPSVQIHPRTTRY